MLREGTVIKAVFLLPLSFCMWATVVAAQDIAACSKPSGHAFYAHRAPVLKDESGWQKDAITGGLVTIKKTGKEKYDVLFVDAYKQIRSSLSEGATIIGVKRSSNDAIFISLYADVVETYHLLRDDQGINIYLNYTDRGGDGMVAKGSLMQGTCSFINFDSID